MPQAGDDSLVLLRRAGRVDPLDIDAYIADGGFDGTRPGPRARPGGRHRGGHRIRPGRPRRRGLPDRSQVGGGPHAAGAPHYLVCNADESEPGTFKDRVLIETDPFNVVESMCIAALATGSEHGYVYIRGEYPRAQATLEHAVAESRRRGYLGDGFDITIVPRRRRLHLR